MITCVPPFRGEFGLKVRYHVPAVAALPRPLVVCIEKGEEALYPNATHIEVESPDDDVRRDVYSADMSFVQKWRGALSNMYPGSSLVMPDRRAGWKERRFIPTPLEMYSLIPESDIVVCPRLRRHAAEKNWKEWPRLVDHLLSFRYMVIAAGHPSTSDLRVRTLATWSFPRVLDATIQALRTTRLVIATDNGLAHLAVLCGAPLLLIGWNGGKVAPGPVTHADGTVVNKEYWPIRMEEYYHKANHTGSPIVMEPYGWENPDMVIHRAREMLR